MDGSRDDALELALREIEALRADVDRLLDDLAAAERRARAWERVARLIHTASRDTSSDDT